MVGKVEVRLQVMKAVLLPQGKQAVAAVAGAPAAPFACEEKNYLLSPGAVAEVVALGMGE